MDIDKIQAMVNKTDGWLTIPEGRLLFSLAKKCQGKGAIVEIGSWKGKSTIWLGHGSLQGNKGLVYAIDPHTGSSELIKMYGKVRTFNDFKKNIKMAKLESIVRPIKKFSSDAFKTWKHGPVELLWIDGAHEFKFVNLDQKLWAPILIEGGVIAFHDTLSGGPRQVVEKNVYLGSKFKHVRFVDGITYGIKTEKLSLINKIENRFIFVLRQLFIFAVSLKLPTPIRKFVRIFLK